MTSHPSQRATRGLHHVTAIAGPAQENLDFYSGVLGLRLVKKSVNQDDPGTYHLFYADAEGRPGTDLTFFPWSDLAPSRRGHGLAEETALAAPPTSLEYWGARLERYGAAVGRIERRFGDRVLTLDRSARPAPRAGRERERRGAPVHRLGRGPGAGRAADPRPRRRPPALARRPCRPPTSSKRCSATVRSARRPATAATASTAAVRALASTSPRTPLRRAAPGAPARSTISPSASRTTSTSSRCATRQKRPSATRRRSSTASGSARSTSASRAACSSSWRPTAPASPSTRRPGISARALVLPPWLEPSRAAIEARLPPLRPAALPEPA